MVCQRQVKQRVVDLREEGYGSEGKNQSCAVAY